MKTTYAQSAHSDLVIALLYEQVAPEDLDAWLEAVREEYERHKPKVATMEQAITAYVKRHPRSQYVQRDKMAADILGIADERDAKMVVMYGRGSGYKHLEPFVQSAFAFRVALERLKDADVIGFRGHGGYYLKERGDPNP